MHKSYYKHAYKVCKTYLKIYFYIYKTAYCTHHKNLQTFLLTSCNNFYTFSLKIWHSDTLSFCLTFIRSTTFPWLRPVVLKVCSAADSHVIKVLLKSLDMLFSPASILHLLKFYWRQSTRSQSICFVSQNENCVI